MSVDCPDIPRVVIPRFANRYDMRQLARRQLACNIAGLRAGTALGTKKSRIPDPPRPNPLPPFEGLLSRPFLRVETRGILFSVWH